MVKDSANKVADRTMAIYERERKRLQQLKQLKQAAQKFLRAIISFGNSFKQVPPAIAGLFRTVGGFSGNILKPFKNLSIRG